MLVCFCVKQNDITTISKQQQQQQQRQQHSHLSVGQAIYLTAMYSLSVLFLNTSFSVLNISQIPKQQTVERYFSFFKYMSNFCALYHIV
jgi:hypothetical protein